MTDEATFSPTLTRKQVAEKLRRKESLADADLRGLDLSGTSFDDADLVRAKLGAADLSRCTFRRANLTGASLWNANLQDATFERANLEDADLDQANLDGVSLLGARVRRTIFPTDRLPMDRIRESVRVGRRLVMEKREPEDLS